MAAWTNRLISETLTLPCCFEGIEHVSDPERLLVNMRAADLALVSSPNADFSPGGFSGNPHHLREWTGREFEALLSRYFSDVRMYFQWHYPDPLDLADRRVRTMVKAVVPGRLKARVGTLLGKDHSRPLDATPLPQMGDDRVNYRVHRATFSLVRTCSLGCATGVRPTG